MLHHNQFRWFVMEYIYVVAETVLRPWLWSFGRVASLFLPTMNETSYVWNLSLLPLFLLFCISWTGPALIAFVIRCFLHYFRSPYQFSSTKNVFSQCSCDNGIHCDLKKKNIATSRDRPKLFSVATANVCLLPEFLSRFNNLSNSKQRSKFIGENIVIDQLFYQGMMKNAYIPNCVKRMETSADKRIVTHFPKVDFLCLQETWDRDVSKILVKELHKVFPWILHDVGITNFRGNFFMLNSGLMFASRYRILDAEFKKFSHSCTQCRFASKGLLMVKVDLGRVAGKHSVGYISNANLQSYQGKSKILDKQLDEIIKWTEEFQFKTRAESDIVKFDILCGDFNFDNMSPADRELSHHSIFTLYEDYARVKSGKDKEWAIGTEMRQKYLHDPLVSTPQGLAQALQDPTLRQLYIVDGNIQVSTISSICRSEPQRDGEGNLVPNSDGSGGRRRIDYILYRKDVQVNVVNYRYVTRLARLTDHVPVCMEFMS